jgi:hypothetical protein
MDAKNPHSDLENEARQQLAALVGSVGLKRFADSMNLSTRHVNRMLSGGAPNPIERLVRLIQCADPDVGDHAVDFICQEVGGHFVRHEAIDKATVNAVRECAEAIAAISDGHVTGLDLREIREAISALSCLIMNLQGKRGG